MSDHRHLTSDGTRELLEYFHQEHQRALNSFMERDRLEEIILEAGRPLTVYGSVGGISTFPEVPVTEADIERFMGRIPNAIKDDNRTGIDDTLHRISVYRERDSNRIASVTIRFGHPIPNVAQPLQRAIEEVRGLLIIGPPARGKTTLLRDITMRLTLAKDPHGPGLLGARVIVIDTSGDIGGFGRRPHPILGEARRVPVPDPNPESGSQTKLILQIIGNHSPRVLVVDEIRNSKEAMALSECAQRGVIPVATCHGWQLAETLNNPSYWPILGNIIRSPSGKLRRSGRPLFGAAVEVWHKNGYIYHPDLSASIDSVLAGEIPECQMIGHWTEDLEERAFTSVRAQIDHFRKSQSEE